MAVSLHSIKPVERKSGQDVGFALGIVFILTVLFLPLPAWMIDLGLAFSIALSVLILMVALWIQRPLDFSAFPTVLLLATLLRLSLNIATTRLILSNGAEGYEAAGHVIAGFASFVMSGDFVIGTIVFVILITVNFLVITKGATRIAEVGARFTLDAIPGKQMAIDADLYGGLIDDKEATRRRRELEEESAFFGSMDGASKFVRGDAIAGIIITAVNVFGGIVIGVTRHDMSPGDAADVFTKLSVGDGLVTQIPALIVSLAAGLLVSKGGTRGSAEKAVFGQLGNYPRALLLAAFGHVRAGACAGAAVAAIRAAGRRPGVHRLHRSPSGAAEAQAAEDAKAQEAARRSRGRGAAFGQGIAEDGRDRALPRQADLGKLVHAPHSELAQRVGKMRRKFAKQYGFVVPEIKLTRRSGDSPEDLPDQDSRHGGRRRRAAHRRRARGHRRRAAARRSRRRGARAGLRHEGRCGCPRCSPATSSARASSPSTTCRCC